MLKRNQAENNIWIKHQFLKLYKLKFLAFHLIYFKVSIATFLKEPFIRNNPLKIEVT